MKHVLAFSLMFAFVTPAFASVTSGTLNTGVATGVATGVEGIVVEAPTASPAAGTYTSAQNVTLTASAGATSMRYTTDGSTPTCSLGTVVSGAISVAASLTVRAIACYPNNIASLVGVFAYGINLPAAPSGGGGGGGGGGGITVRIGDINADGRVDLLDFNALIVAWGGTGSNLPADLNRDGVVDLLDFNVLLVNWTA